jgi:hypothetical protein
MTEFVKKTGYWYAPDKDPNAVLDYIIDWTDWLNGDTITDSAWIVPTGITKESENFTDEKTTIWISGGTAGTTYLVINRITTGSGRINDQSFKIYLKEL